MTTTDYTLDDAGLLHDAHGRFVSRDTRIAWELARAHANTEHYSMFGWADKQITSLDYTMFETEKGETP
jgi:hypothetical protein